MALSPTGSRGVNPLANVTSVFTRTGAVVAANGDYTAAQVSALAATAAAGGDLTGNYPNPTLAAAGGGAVGPIGSATVAPVITVDAKGRVTALTSANITAGQSAAQVAAAVGGVAWTVVTKTLDESVTSSTTLQNDDELTFTGTSGGVYEVELLVVYGSPAGGTTPDIKIALVEDGTIRGAVQYAGISTADAVSLSGLAIQTGSQATLGTDTVNRAVKMYGSYVSAGAALTFQWAQSTSNANATIVRAGSVIRYRRIV